MYQLTYAKTALKELNHLPAAQQRLLTNKLKRLEHNPWPTGTESLKGFKGLYRLRQGNYRAIYTVKNDQLIVLVLVIGHRREVYRKI